MDLPRISIITPVLNGDRYLEDTILSVINQDYPNLEYIIIDGGSSDNTIEIIKKYQKHITFWVSEQDDGLYHAIQKGFNKSTGEIMAWINSDDIYHPWSLNCVGQIFSQLDQVSWITGRPTLLNSEGLCVKIEEKQRWSINRIKRGDYKWIQQENTFWRRELWEKTGAFFHPNLKLAADFELWIRYFKCEDLHSVNTSLASFRLHENQLSIEQKVKYENEVEFILSENRLKNTNGLFKLISRLKTRNNFISVFLRTNLQYVLNLLNRYPPIIYYDITNTKWSMNNKRGNRSTQSEEKV